MRFFDTHCHLDFPVLAEQPALLAACRKAGVEQLVIPGVARAGWERVLATASGSAGVHAALGLHPGYVDQHREADLARLEAWLGREPVVAIGEIGLDGWEGCPPLEEQQPWFKAQLALAERFQLPVMLHVRKAHDQVLYHLRRARLPRGGVIHAFSGSQQQAEAYIKLGVRIGVGGAVTYPRAKRLRRIVAALPIEALVLETDAPDMPLCGHQGEPNSPLRLPQVFTTVAALRQEPAQRLAEQLYRNSCALYGVPA